MSVDMLQNRIRKLKNPSMVLFSLDKTQIPPAFLEGAESTQRAYDTYARALLAGLRELIPAVRFDFSTFALCGAEGLQILRGLMDFSFEQGFYVLLDVPVSNTPQSAVAAAEMLSDWRVDGLLLNCYLGSDGVKPYVEHLQDRKEDLFFLLRTANKSAPELQDLISGTRLVYTVAGDMAKRLGEDMLGKCGYSRIAGVGPATSADSLRSLRSKYPSMFLLIDGYDYSGANAKNCAAAFDKLGHGAVACAGSSIIAAWQEAPGDPVSLACEAAERMKKNLSRYIAIL